MTKSDSATWHVSASESALGERLRFLIWLGELRLGTRNQQDFADAVGKGASQLSSWLKGEPRPAFESIRPVAEQLGVSALWVYDPSARDAREPELWREWFENGQARAKKRVKEAPEQRAPRGVAKRERKPASDLAAQPTKRRRRKNEK